MILLNILFVLTSIPVVTIGMSLSAMYRVTLRMARKESNYVAREYFSACKEEWKKSTVIWLILLVTGMLLVFDVMVGKDMPNMLNLAVGILLFVWGILFTYVFAVQARFENTVKNILKNALYMAVRHFPFTIVMLILNAIPVVCIIFGSAVMALTVPLYIVFGFALTARINSVFLNRIFKKYIPKEEKESGEDGCFREKEERDADHATA